MRDGQAAGADVTTLHVRSVDGSRTLVVKMFAVETVGDVMEALRGAGALDRDGVQLCATFPTRVLSELGASLRESGLCPAARLVLRCT